ncbi:type II secretion system protein [Cellulomonas sp.]|uniref:type II secretion system protein n=1 Tax=Cellulomonas sp. TaxID=40001 RepID=UPI003BABC598
MIARIRKSIDEKDKGFTLIELLVVMIIIGILAAIAIPVFLNQRKKAVDTATKADVSTVGKEIATYFVDGTGTLTATIVGNTLTLADGATPAYSTAIKLSNGTVAPTTGNASAALSSNTGWCIALGNPNGDKLNFKYSAAGGLEAGTC